MATTIKKLNAKVKKDTFGKIQADACRCLTIGSGMLTNFGKLVSSISQKKAHVGDLYNFIAHSGPECIVFTFGIVVGDQRFAVDAYVRAKKKSTFTLMTPPSPRPDDWEPKSFPFSENGVKKLLKEIKVI